MGNSVVIVTPGMLICQRYSRIFLTTQPHLSNLFWWLTKINNFVKIKHKGNE